MADEKQKPKVEEKEQPKLAEAKPEVSEEKKEEKKETKPLKVKKEEAIAKGLNLHASMKHCMYISRFIKNKTIDSAIHDLEDVLKLKRAIPFKGEIPHRGKGMMSGRYPLAAIKELIPVLKGLKGNVLANSMELDKTRIYFASPTWASRPAKRGGAHFKRTNILLKAREVPTKEAAK